MRPFIGTDDLGALLGRSVSDSDLITAIALDSGCESVRSYVQQTINYVEDDIEEYDGRGTNKIRLTQRPVRALTSVEVDDKEQDLTNFSLRKSMLRWKTDWFPVGYGNVVITYDHGYDIIPDDSAGDDVLVPADLRLVALLAARRVYINVGAMEGVLQSESIGKYSYSKSITAAAASAAELLLPEMRVLDRYKIGKH